MADNDVLIVGAGPTGMTAAIELKRAGMEPRLVDKSDHLAWYSQALVVQARTLEQFQRYGIAEEMMAHGRKLHEAKFYSEGKLIVDFKLDKLASRYPFALFIPQSETERVLNDFMESLGVKTERCVELVSLRQDSQPRATLRHANGRTEDISPRWVIGCDGAHSAVREQTGTAFEGGGVGLSFYLGDCEVEGEDLPREELSLHVHHGDVLFMARLTDRVVRLIAALHEQSANAKQEITVDDLQGIVDRIGVRVKIKSAEWLTPFHVNDRQAKHYRIGNVFLAGDASHIHSPVGGQGMNTGIQDAANLCWKLAAAARGAENALLDSYEEERGEVGKALLRFTKRGLKLATTANPIVERVRDTLAPLVTKLPPVQHNAIGFVSETAIEYRSSSAVRDYGGDGHLRAGDRVPDLALKNPNGRSSLLKDWTSPRHRVIGLNLDKDDIETLRDSVPRADVVALKTADLGYEGRRLFGDDGKLFVLRPDGYLGFRAPMGFNVELMNYARHDGMV
ncbi:MAG TPA: FAD-dependent monooxygenase [Terracidiphilus sp.]|jgi:2-polyprenyl-6-methoxyphenol hydroxylase-like FAD-dependent oxidoreductase